MNIERKILPVLSALPAFEEAARAGSFTKAGDVLGMAQPSVSRFIANLENHVGVPLFDRRHNRIALTPEGETLYDATVLGLAHIRSAIEEISQARRGPAVTVGCTHGLAHMWILPRIEGLQALLPGRDIRMMTMDHVAKFSTGDVDFALRFGDGRWPDGEAWLLFEEEVFPVCSPSFAARHDLLARDASPEMFPSLPLLMQDHGQHGWLGWGSWLAHFGIDFTPPKGAHLIYNYAFILQAAMEGEGITLAWENLCEPHLSNSWLVEIPGFRVKTGNGYYLVFSPDNPTADAARAWIEGMA